jgi:hypothetical protein
VVQCAEPGEEGRKLFRSRQRDTKRRALGKRQEDSEGQLGVRQVPVALGPDRHGECRVRFALDKIFYEDGPFERPGETQETMIWLASDLTSKAKRRTAADLLASRITDSPWPEILRHAEISERTAR